MLGRGKRSARARSFDRNGWNEDDNVAGMADNFEKEESLEIEMERKRPKTDFWVFLRSSQYGGRENVENVKF